MADITTVNNNVSLKDLLLNNISTYRYNPSNIQRTILDYLSTVTNGLVDIVDPTNPFIFLLGASCVNTSVAMSENRINLQKLYPKLSQSLDDLYVHMSDKDFTGVFSTPSKTNFTWMIQYSSLVNNMVYDAVEKCNKAIIPRNTTIVVDGITFSLQYPVTIRLYSNDEIQVSYDGSKVSPLQTLSTNVISTRLLTDSSNVKWLLFNTDVFQFDIKTSYFTAQSSTIFQEEIAYDDKYYYCRVFYRNGQNYQWSEMTVTLTDQVYDPFVPTAVIQPNDQTKKVQIFIPPIYMSSGLIDGDIRIDVYETKGEIQVDLSNYELTSFITTLLAIDEDNDINEYTNALLNVSLLAFSAQYVSGGSNGLSFSDLRSQVINNSTGNVNIPITNVQLESEVNLNGFSIVKNVDVVTNRIFLAVQSLPSPLNTQLVTSANLTIDTLITNMDKLRLLDSVADNGNRMTILSKTLYKSNNGQLSIVQQSVADSIKILPLSTLCSTVNSSSYLYSPFYYVLDDTDSEFVVRPYHLDAPVLSNLSFVSQNATAGIQVNTKTFAISKTETGYRIAIEVVSDTFYKTLADKYIQVQLCYVPVGEANFAYINGTLSGINATSGERIFTFDIETNWDLDTNDNLILSNFEMFSNEVTLTGTPLQNTFTLLWTTNSVPVNFIADSANKLQGSFLLPPNTIVVTQEQLDITFGHSLKNLWCRSRSVASMDGYETYAEDVPMTYLENVYAEDPVTGSHITFDETNKPIIQLLHKQGDTVYDAEGNIVYLHQAGDIKLDSNNNPVPLSNIYTDRMIDLLLVDGAYYFVTDAAYIKYRSEIAATLNTWITETLSSIQAKLLDKTEIYYHPTSAIGSVQIQISQNNTTSIESRQSLAVVLYVNTNVYNDTALRQQLEINTIRTLNESLRSNTISIDDMIAALKDIYGPSVISVNLSGLGGSANYNTVTIVNQNDTLSLNKVLKAQDDGTLIVAEDVDIQFIEYSNS